MAGDVSTLETDVAPAAGGGAASGLGDEGCEDAGGATAVTGWSDGCWTAELSALCVIAELPEGGRGLRSAAGEWPGH